LFGRKPTTSKQLDALCSRICEQWGLQDTFLQEANLFQPHHVSVFLLRTGSQGNSLWMKKYPGFNLHDMETVGNQSFILVGRANVTVLRVSASGLSVHVQQHKIYFM
jgi:hypothetical protein